MPSNPQKTVDANGAFDELTSDEMEELEELTEQPLGAIFSAFEEGTWSTKHLKAIAFVTAKREDPDLDFKTFKFSAAEFGEIFGPSQ
jgi:hypothetical protein